MAKVMFNPPPPPGEWAPPQRQMPVATPVTLGLLVLNLGIFLIDVFFLDRKLTLEGAFSIRSAIGEGRFWEFLSFQFLHDSVAHVLLNCVALYFFGPWLERWWGAARFLAFYLLCGIGGACFFILLLSLGILPDSIDTGLIGASAGIYGILIGAAVIAPNLRIMLLFPPIEMSIRTLAWLMIAIASFSILLGLGGNEGGEAGHLGGAILGFILIRYPWLLRHPTASRQVSSARHTRHKRTEPWNAILKPRTTVDLSAQSEVDRILDKISQHGLHSLTEEERDFLRNAADSSHHE